MAVYDDRIQVRCSPAQGDIAYFAYGSDPLHSANASRYLALADTAYALGSHLWVYYHASSAMNPSGCQTSDCRGIWGLSMVPQP